MKVRIVKDVYAPYYSFVPAFMGSDVEPETIKHWRKVMDLMQDVQNEMEALYQRQEGGRPK